MIKKTMPNKLFNFDDDILTEIYDFMNSKVNTLNDQIKLEFILENFENISLEDLEKIKNGTS